MVSLGNENRQGARFFGPDQTESSLNYSSSDELLGDHIELSVSTETPFQPVKTTWAAVLWILVLAALVTESFLLPTLCHGDTCGTTPVISCLSYSWSVTWFLIYLLDRFICYQHNVSRRNGYLEFYRRTCALRKVPVIVYSAGCSIFIITITILRDHCSNNSCNTVINAPLTYLQILGALVAVVIIPCVIIYIVRTTKFNRRQAPPDVKEDNTSSYLLSQVQTSEIGFRDEGYLDEVLEKQADMIRYLKQHNANLGKKILKLTTQLNSRGGSHL